MSQVPSQHRALLLDEKHGKFVLGSSQLKKPGPGQLVVKIKATALNPVDWKIKKYGAFVTAYPAIVGTDLSGEVAAVGEGVTKFAVGDKVLCQGSLKNDYASFQEYTLADEAYLAKIPSNISFDEAASIPLGLTTAFLGLYNQAPHGIGLVSPAEPAGQGHYKDEPFVVLGGASSVGQFAIQLGKLSGFSPIIVTASVKHTPYLQSLGATHVLDRNLSTAELKAQIDHITNHKPVKYAYDAISLPGTQATAVEILTPGGQLVVVLDPVVKSADRTITHTIAFRDAEFNAKSLKALYSNLTEWVESGIIKPNKVTVLSGGLSGIIEGLQRMENDQVSGVKLVVHPEETPV